jgi:hypothetical protein
MCCVLSQTLADFFAAFFAASRFSAFFVSLSAALGGPMIQRKSL